MNVVINITGIDTFDEDIKRLNETLSECLDDGIKKLKRDMRIRLLQSVDKNVYAKYTPTMYPRRKDNPQFGTPLDDISNIKIKDLPMRRDYGRGFEFSYEPNGNHKGTWGDIYGEGGLRSRHLRLDGTTRIVPYPVHGDQLIKRIEEADYNWDTDAPPRRFYTEFAEEILDHRAGEVIKRSFDKFVKEFDGEWMEVPAQAEQTEAGTNGYDYI